MGYPIKTYEISVFGYPPALYSARHPAKARARCWSDFRVCNDATFKEFLKISRIRRVPDPQGIGRRIMVAGEPATTVIGYGQYVHYMRDYSDDIICSHPADVTEISPAIAALTSDQLPGKA